ncbi:MAG: PadR family transcriptional regulator [Longimicrobiales bacterium]
MTTDPTLPEDIRNHLPLTPVVFEILLALSDGERHGYALMQAVEERTGGAVRLHAGTLYRALARLVEAGCLDEVDPPAAEEADERRRYYALTSLGRRIGAAEARRLESQVGAARAQGLLEGLERA